MNNKQSLSFIESLKGIAIILIIMMHCGSSSLPGLLGSFGSDMGTIGVSVFMLISGFLAFISFSHAQNSSTNAFKWLLKRFIRLFPLYFIAIVITLITGTYSIYWLGTETSVSIWNFLTHVVFVHGLFPHYCNSILSVEWYVGALALFYLITPFLFKIITSIDKALVALIISILTCPIMNTLVYKLMPVSSDPTIYEAYKNTFSPLRVFPVYMLGIALYFVIIAIQENKTIKSMALSYTFIGFSLIMIVGQFTGNNTLFHFSSYIMYGFWFSIIILGLTIRNNLIFDNPIWRVIGHYSYPMYLFQYLFILLYERYLANYNIFVIKFVTVTVALFITGIIVTKAIDEPIQKKIKHVPNL